VQLLLLARAQARHGQPQRQRLERLAHLVGVEELAARQPRDDRAAARDHRHQALGGQLSERLAQRPAADPQRARERDLAQLGAGLQAARENLLAQVVEHLLAQRAVLERGVGRGRGGAHRAPRT